MNYGIQDQEFSEAIFVRCVMGSWSGGENDIQPGFRSSSLAVWYLHG